MSWRLRSTARGREAAGQASSERTARQNQPRCITAIPKADWSLSGCWVCMKESGELSSPYLQTSSSSAAPPACKRRRAGMCSQDKRIKGVSILILTPSACSSPCEWSIRVGRAQQILLAWAQPGQSQSSQRGQAAFCKALHQGASPDTGGKAPTPSPACARDRICPTSPGSLTV